MLSDSVGIGGHEASGFIAFENVAANTQFEFPLNVVAGEYIFIRVTEENGKDNAEGDGIDEVKNDTGFIAQIRNVII